MRTIFILFEPFGQVIDVASVSALSAFQKGLICKDLFAANLADSHVFRYNLPIIDALVNCINRIEETSDSFVWLADLCIVESLFIAAPFVVFQPFKLLMLTGELKSLPELDIIFLQKVKFVSEIGYCF